MRYYTQTPVGDRNIIFLKWFCLAVLILGTVTMATGCGGLSDKEANTYYERAVPIGQDYFKKYYDADVEFTEFYINVPMSSTMVLNGYPKDDPYTKVSLTFYLPSLEIEGASGPGEFIDKRKSEEEVNSK
ncbi:hypothetical protein PAECIP112173_03225 [Paenibacillus sp. JJ-100]|uniref:hypothetical protein n=1 Tax=Paenibacillus sp. JJ-100 TaxID=2974896 RepID=UPI0022FF9669|nr:hypothetical protein [Paenibacillus sp. JJ-100]CAI6081490.1 hypothetical protein PAECIP112173_03225 [Paenibacillus sp. JJ-100]